MNEFEQKLSRQQLRPIPAEWRMEILSAAKSVARATPQTSRPNFLSIINRQCASIFWPNPKAWAALAAIWIFILAVNFSLRDKTPMIAEKAAPPSPEVIAQLRQQRLLFAQLMGSIETHDADRQKTFLPRPRTERPFEMLTA